MSELVIDPGALNRRLILEAPAETADGLGGVVRDYDEVAAVWAAVEPASAHGDVIAAHQGATVTHRIVLRHRADVTTRHRLRDGTRVLRIVTIKEHGKRFLEIEAQERIA